MSKLFDKYFKAVMNLKMVGTNVKIERLSKETQDIKENQMKILQLKSTKTETKASVDEKQRETEEKKILMCTINSPFSSALTVLKC